MAASVPTPMNILLRPLVGFASLATGGIVALGKGRSRTSIFLVLVAVVMLAPRRAIRDALRAFRARVAAQRGVVLRWPADEDETHLAMLREAEDDGERYEDWSSGDDDDSPRRRGRSSGRGGRRTRVSFDDRSDEEEAEYDEDVDNDEVDLSGARTPSGGRRRRSARQRPRLFVVAKYDFQARAADELSFTRGDPFLVLDRSNGDWWRVESATGARGLIPATFCRLRPSGTQRAQSALGIAEDDREFERRI